MVYKFSIAFVTLIAMNLLSLSVAAQTSATSTLKKNAAKMRTVKKTHFSEWGVGTYLVRTPNKLFDSSGNYPVVGISYGLQLSYGQQYLMKDRQRWGYSTALLFGLKNIEDRSSSISYVKTAIPEFGALVEVSYSKSLTSLIDSVGAYIEAGLLVNDYKGPDSSKVLEKSSQSFSNVGVHLNLKLSGNWVIQQKLAVYGIGTEGNSWGFKLCRIF